jgi:hypothetical protein
MPRQKKTNLPLLASFRLHQIVTRRAVNVNVHEPGSENTISEVCNCHITRKFCVVRVAHTNYMPVLNEDQGAVNFF